MIDLTVSIEIDGIDTKVGNITGNNSLDSSFCYSDDYIMNGLPVSFSLPIKKEPFTPEETIKYFDGLLPEGFTRRSVAQLMHVDENNYLQILSELGKECLGAIKIKDTLSSDSEPGSYQHLTNDEIRKLAQEGTSKSTEIIAKSHLSLTGASGKVGLYYDKKNNEWYLPIGNAPSTHIVKQSHVRLNGIVTNEQLCQMTAKRLGIDVPKSFIINTGKRDDSEILLATERYDRISPEKTQTKENLSVPRRLHQEDFAQALGIRSSDKYENSDKQYFKKMFDLLRSNSANPVEDMLKAWDIIVFDYLIGNTDAHIKNFSLLYSSDLKSVRLAPAYDLLSTTVYESSTRDMAFKIGGKYSIDEIKRDTFIEAANEVGIGYKLAMKHFDILNDKFESALTDTANELYDMGFKNVPVLKDKILLSGGYSILNK